MFVKRLLLTYKECSMSSNLKIIKLLIITNS